jgi:mannose-6-phosphate isomerase-like protein (cupin superfamily)
VTELTIIPPGGGEVIGDAPDRRVEILSECESLHATWSRFGPGRDGADLHVHRRHTDLFYVLDGELTIRLGPAGEEVAAPAGTLARVPPGVVHGFRNASDAEVRYLNLHAPGRGFVEYMRAMRDGRTLTYDQFPPPDGGGRPISEVVIGGDGPVLADVEEIRVAEASVEPDATAPAPHADDRRVESFYVLDGELRLTVGARELSAEAGSWIQIPPGVSHTDPQSGGPARYLHLRTPNGARD